MESGRPLSDYQFPTSGFPSKLRPNRRISEFSAGEQAHMYLQRWLIGHNIWGAWEAVKVSLRTALQFSSRGIALNEGLISGGFVFRDSLAVIGNIFKVTD